MPHSFRAALAAALVLFSPLSLFLPGAARAQDAVATNLERVEVAGRKTEVSPWFRAESQHFVVYSDTREEDVAPLLDNLEKLDRLLRAYTQPRQPQQPQPSGASGASGASGEPQDSKLTLYYHASLSGLRSVAGSTPADAIGLYSGGAGAAQGFGVHLERIAPLGDEQLEKAPLNDSLTYVFEAYARHFLRSHTAIRAPAWFIEGFAQYFSSVRFSAQQAVVGRAPRDVAGYLRFLGSGRKYHLEWEDVLEHRQPLAHGHGGEDGMRLEFEAKSWLLMHYAFSSDDNRKRLSRYLQRVGDGASPTAAFERAFGVTSADLGRVMWRYGQRGLEVVRGVLPSMPATQVSFRALTRAAGDAVLAQATQAARSPDEPLKEWTFDKRRVLQKVELSAGLEDADAFIKGQQQQQGPSPSPSPTGGAGAGRR
jgi:hypothetical protein